MNLSSVTIVIPTFNRAAMLCRCIDSALAQSHPCEVIVVDHGSRDETPTVVASYGNRIRYIRREEDRGVHFCWMDGVINASGEWIHINFDDDYLAPEFIEKCMSLSGPEVGVVFSKVALRDEKSGRIECYLYEGFGSTGHYSSDLFMERQLRGLISPGATILRKKDILDALFIGKVPFARFEYHGVGPDWLMTSMTTLHYRKVGFVDEPLAIFSSHAGSITVSAVNDEKRKKAFDQAYHEARRFFALLWLAKSFRLDFIATFTLALLRLRARYFVKLRRLFHFTK